MPCFDQQFQEAKGQPINYNGVQLVRIDRFPVKNGDILLCNIEKINENSPYIQGFCIDVTGHAEVNGHLMKQGKGIRLLFWADGLTQGNEVKLFTKKDSVVIYNVCERETTYLIRNEMGEPLEKHSKTVDYWVGGAAMILEEIPQGKRYRCSDPSCGEKEDQFGDIVFTIQKSIVA